VNSIQPAFPISRWASERKIAEKAVRGPVQGHEIRVDVVFDPPIDLPADHYFFVPQVRLQGTGGNFLWLSTPRPPLAFVGDLQMWIRNADLDPDWLRVGTDIVDDATPPTFNGSFSLSGTR
jgi:hypothetical protein